ncbi:DUF1203 domain-containing protein [soil metagenome]
MSFLIRPLPADEFADLFALSDEALHARRARRVVADRPRAFPCRVSLEDAQPGETVMLANFTHQAADTPFRASHAVYVREGIQSAVPEVNEVPEQLRRRTLSLRAFDAGDMMIAADLADGVAMEPVVEALLADPRTAYLHAHFAKQGCYAARIDRA